MNEVFFWNEIEIFWFKSNKQGMFQECPYEECPSP